jgi:hypothetical protein
MNTFSTLCSRSHWVVISGQLTSTISKLGRVASSAAVALLTERVWASMRCLEKGWLVRMLSDMISTTPRLVFPVVPMMRMEDGIVRLTVYRKVDRMRGDVLLVCCDIEYLAVPYIVSWNLQQYEHCSASCPPTILLKSKDDYSDRFYDLEIKKEWMA